MQDKTVSSGSPRRVPCRAGLLALAMTSLAACSNNDIADLKRFVADTRLKHQGRVDPLPTFTPYESYTYIETSLRDPFRAATALSANARPAAGTPRPTDDRRRESLENFPLDALKMVGILKQRSSSWALVQDPEGTIHRVQPGNYAGQNHGKITQISENQIKLVELVPDGISGWIQRDAKLALGDE